MNFKQVIDKILGRKKYRNALEELMDDEPFFRGLFIVGTILIIAFLLIGCGDFNVNVDKEAIKMEVDSLIDGFESEKKK